MRLPFGGLRKDNPAFPLLMAGIAYWGVTSGNGVAGGTTLVCADLDNHPTYMNGACRVKIFTGGAWGQDRLMTIHAAGGVITVDAAFTNAAGAPQQILAGTLFVILSSSGGGGGGGGGAPVLYASGTQLAVVLTEHFLSSPNVAGTFRLQVDTVNMVAGDTVELRVYKMVLAAGASRVAHLMTYFGVQPVDELIKISLPIANTLIDANAVRFSLTQTTGVGRNFPWAVIQT